MGEINAGGSYWVGPYTNATDDDEGYWLLTGGDPAEHPIPLGVPVLVVHHDEMLPDSPALGPVARWLAEPRNRAELRELVERDLRFGKPHWDGGRAFRALVAALAGPGEEGDES